MNEKNNSSEQKDNDYALLWASRNGYTDVVKLLIEIGKKNHD